MSGTVDAPGVRVLVVTAVAAERDAVLRGLPSPRDTDPREAGQGDAHTIDVRDVGVGPAGAAAGTTDALTRAALAGNGYHLVISAGIGGGYTPTTALGDLVVAQRCVAADLGSESPDGFLPVSELGFGTSEHAPPPTLPHTATDALRRAGLPTHMGDVLTVSTTTGSASRAAELTRRHPRAVAEAMEGFGVAEAAAAHQLPTLEIRAVSNHVGPRDRSAWRIPDALLSLGRACAALHGVLPALVGAVPPWCAAAHTAPSPGGAPPGLPDDSEAPR